MVLKTVAVCSIVRHVNPFDANKSESRHREGTPGPNDIDL